MQDFQSQYEVLDQIYQRDGSRFVFLCRILKDQQLVALKRIFFSEISELNSKSKEYISMIEFKHPFICKVLSVSIKKPEKSCKSSLDIFLEYFPEGNLISLIKSRNSPWTDYEIIKMSKNLVEAYSFLQSNSIAHRDIKPQNILVTASGTVLKIADFGEAERIETFNNLRIAGTRSYLSPQLLPAYDAMTFVVSYNPYKSDVFSLALVLVQMMTLDLHPIKTENEKNAMKTLKKLKKKYPVSSLILEKMIVFDEEKRVDFLELKEFFDLVYLSKFSFTCDGCKVRRFPEDFYVFDGDAMCKICADNLQTFPLGEDFNCFCRDCDEIFDPSFECSCGDRCMTCKVVHDSQICCCDVLRNWNDLEFNLRLSCTCGGITDRFKHDCVLSCENCECFYCIVCLKSFERNEHMICHFVLRNRFRLNNL